MTYSFKLFSMRLCAFALALLTAGAVHAQQNPNIAEESHPLGFSLKKVVSNTAIPTGATFSYTIYYSFPAGTQNVTLTDVLPQSLVFHSLSVSSSCGTYTTSVPTPGTNGTVNVTWNFPPSSSPCSGSLTIVVSFPSGTTCNGTVARNSVCLKGSVVVQGQQQSADFCTPYVSTTAQASNPWTIDKQVLNSTYIGGNCPRALNSDTVTYRICVAKTPGLQGQLNLVGGIVTDVLPAGAQFISATCPGVNASGNTITWNVGNLLATQMYNSVCCDIKVYYPPSLFPTGSNITNTATLSGQLGSAQQPCGQFSQSASVCWKKTLPPPPTTTASIYKWVSTNGQPGCGGYYTVQVCNTGNTPINSATITDNVPSVLTITSTSSSGGLTISTTGNIVTATLSTPLQPGECRWLYIYFNILSTATPNATITNCAQLQVPGIAPVQSCASFVVQSPAPAACIFKEICSPQASYSLGQTIRMRLRLQNIGGQNISGATITDNLDPNFEYVGNPVFYTTNTWNTPCNPQNPSAWMPTPSLSGGQTVSIGNIQIPATCQNLFWSGCGYYGNTGVPYYWIEFDVKIRDTAGLGNIPNYFTISGGGLMHPVQSNTVYVLVTGNTGFTLNKQVASDTAQWQSALTTAAGSVANYRLQMNIPTGSVPLRHVTFVDLLPLDNGSADQKILQACVSRNSQFSLTYNGGYLATPTANNYSNNASGSLADANSISGATGAPALFSNKCGTAGSWSSSLATGAKNLGFYFPTAVGSSTGATVIVPVKVDANAAPGQIACNTFAAGGAVRHYLNSSTFNDVAVGPLESAPVCISIDSSAGCYSVQLTGEPQPVGTMPTPTGNACKYQINVAVNNPGPAVQGGASSLQGTVSPSSFSVPTGASTLTFTFTDTPPQDNFACIYYGIVDPTGGCKICDSVCFDLPPCPPKDTCCPRFEILEVKCIGQDAQGNIAYSIVASGVIPCPATLIVSTPEGTFTPSSFSIGPGTFTINTTFTDVLPLASGSIIVYYSVGQGVVVLCRDSVKIQLPPCPIEETSFCCRDWYRSIQSSATWFSNGTVQITGTATAGPIPVLRFGATIVSAQRKRWCPIIPPLPPSPWQRIFGDITSGSLTPAPGAPQMLSPFSREVIWDGLTPNNCQDWVQSPANFQLNMLFPAPAVSKCGDSLQFTVRYSFTDCECHTCDTLITYTLVRKKRIVYPWDHLTVRRAAWNALDIYLPGTQATSEDNTTEATLEVLELQSTRPQDVQVCRWNGVGTDCSGPANDVMVELTENGCVMVFPKGKNSGYILRKIDDKLPVLQSERAILRWQETDIQGGASESVSEEKTLTIPPLSLQPQFELVQDQENKPAHTRTFALAFVNGKESAQGAEVELKALPHPDGSLPIIIAMGPVDRNGVAIQCPSDRRCGYVIEQPLGPGEIFRPLYITMAADRREFLDLVEVEYTIRDATGTIIQKGVVFLEGNVLQAEETSEEALHSPGGVEIVSIVPNPASERTTIGLRSGRMTNHVDVALYDALGRPVAQLLSGAALPEGTTALPVDVATLPPGVYTVVVRSPQGVIGRQFVVAR